MYPILEAIELSGRPEIRTQVMLDGFRPNPGFTYTGRTVIIRMPSGTEFTTNVVDIRENLGVWSLILPIMLTMTPGGSHLRFLSHGVIVE